MPHDVSTHARSVPVSFKIGLVFFVLAGGGVFLLLNSEAGDAMSYSKLVPDVVANPAAHRGRQLRVEGDLRPGSIAFRESPCEWRFVIERDGHSLPVAFPECVVPDTFRDGFDIKVTVRGYLQDDGSFLANEVIPRCPSKYEMNEKLEAGEEVPHAMKPSGA
jgi:cytochrome c-type biogenesis protein CcmE